VFALHIFLTTHDQLSQPQTQTGDELSDLRLVFRWLRKNNVKRILKVTVIDYGTPSHRDSVIEDALADFRVESWDWKKVDMCSDVISNSTEDATQISLYSSCNNAVLMGWASSEGLANKIKFPKARQLLRCSSSVQQTLY
jgi:hypothetical protein